MTEETMRKTSGRKRCVMSLLLLTVVLYFRGAVAGFNYQDALMKSILFYEAQRSGPLNLTTLRNTWRNSSALKDGFQQGVDLTGGYYDAGDNVKFHFPLSFTMTMLSWSIVEYRNELASAGQLDYALDALKWGTDYLLKCHTAPNVFWGQVGVGGNDHNCWQRSEDMSTQRTAFKIDALKPGSDLAGEAAAAMAAASMAFSVSNPSYANALLTHSKQLFTFANSYKGVYSKSITDASGFYNSWSGYNDELAWAATWLYKATSDASFLSYLVTKDSSLGTSGTSMNEFSWDNKYAGAQILLSGVLFFSPTSFDSNTATYLNNVKKRADAYACSLLLKKSVTYTPQGLLYYRGVNMQYVMNAAFLMVVYRDYLQGAGRSLSCDSTTLKTSDMLAFSKRQVDYMLGDNKAQMSYMVGFGSKYPLNPHHRGASIVSIRVKNASVPCSNSWYTSANPNPNILTGAIVGGPDSSDSYVDQRSQYSYGEPTTYTNAPAVGVLAKLYGLYSMTPSPTQSPPPPPPPSSIPPPVSSTPNSSPPPASIPSPPPPASSSTPISTTSPPPRQSSPPPPSPPPRNQSSPPPESLPPPPLSVSFTEGNQGIAIFQNATRQWTDKNIRVTQFDVVLSYGGSGTAKSVMLLIPSFAPLGYWGIDRTSNLNVYKLPNWARINAKQNYSFGYQGYSKASISVSSYAIE